MMKVLVVLSLVAIACATTMHSLSEISGATTTGVAVTSTLPDALTPPTLLTFTYPTTTYDSSATTLAPFVIAGTASVVGNNTVGLGQGFITITFTSGSDALSYNLGLTTSSSTNVVTIGSTIRPVFRNAGPYAVSVSFVTDLFQSSKGVLASGGFPSVPVTPYTTAPTITTLSIASPQNGGCDDTLCTFAMNANATVSVARGGLSLELIFRPTTAASAVLFKTIATETGATGNFNFAQNAATTLTAYAGAVVNGIPFTGFQLGQTLLPKNQATVVSASITDSAGTAKTTYSSESSVNTQTTFNVGTADVTAPTCSVATLTPATITTTDRNNLQQATLTVTCVDEVGGSGVYAKGAFARVQVTSGSPFTFTIPLEISSGNTDNFNIQPYLSGSMSLVGVWAIDNAGNMAMYGNCGSVYNNDPTGSIFGCTGGSSGAATVSVSIFAMAAMALLAFFA